MKKFFTMIGAALMAGSFAAQAEAVEFWVEAYDYRDYIEKESFQSEITKNDDGSFTIKEFFNSGYPVSFKLNGGENVYDYGTIVMCDNIFKPEGYSYPYLMIPGFSIGENGWPNDDEYLTCAAYDEGSEEPTYIWYPYVDDEEDPTYSSYFMRCDPEEYGGDYFACLILSGSNSEGGYADWYYVSFMFSEPTESAVKTIDNDANAPVEFYNINGTKVANPQNGIFIRKQGNQTSKVILK